MRALSHSTEERPWKGRKKILDSKGIQVEGKFTFFSGAGTGTQDSTEKGGVVD